VHPRIERYQKTSRWRIAWLAAIGQITAQHSTSMSGRQGGKLKPLKVNIPFNDTISRSL
jgi:hypothetical protein